MNNKVLGALGIVVGIACFKAFFGANVSYRLAEGEVKASKSEAWQEGFKQEFMTACVNSPEAGFDESMKPRVTQYCSCMANLIESKHIIATKYNKLKQNEEQAAVETRKAVEGFLSSTEGKKGVESCVTQAVAATPELGAPSNRKPASEE